MRQAKFIMGLVLTVVAFLALLLGSVKGDPFMVFTSILAVIAGISQTTDNY